MTATTPRTLTIVGTVTQLCNKLENDPKLKEPSGSNDAQTLTVHELGIAQTAADYFAKRVKALWADLGVDEMETDTFMPSSVFAASLAIGDPQYRLNEAALKLAMAAAKIPPARVSAIIKDGKSATKPVRRKKVAMKGEEK